MWLEFQSKNHHWHKTTLLLVTSIKLVKLPEEAQESWPQCPLVTTVLVMLKRSIFLPVSTAADLSVTHSHTEQTSCSLVVSPTRACSRYTPSHSRLLTPHRASSTAACRFCLTRLLPAVLRCALHRGRLLFNLFPAGSAMLPSGHHRPQRNTVRNERWHRYSNGLCR